jgi:hypothetical protein
VARSKGLGIRRRGDAVPGQRAEQCAGAFAELRVDRVLDSVGAGRPRDVGVDGRLPLQTGSRDGFSSWRPVSVQSSETFRKTSRSSSVVAGSVTSLRS